MSIAQDLRVLYHMALAPIRGDDHAARLESFYRGQASSYDAFRKHLLQGRRELYESLPVPSGGIWVEMGGGTASNLEYLGPRIADLGRIYVVDLSESLLAVARDRIESNRWNNAAVCKEDVTTFALEPGSVDVVTFSYSLTMIPDWFAAIDNARRLLKPGGFLGAVDFLVARKHPAAGQARQSWWMRTFWPAWLGLDNVFPNADHVPYLQHHFQTQHFSEHRMRMRYFPLWSVPYYRFVGRRS